MIKVKDQLREACEIKVDLSKRLIYEVLRGEWNEDKYNAFDSFYRVNCGEDIQKMYQWCKIIDMREYQLSSVIDSIRTHLDWCITRGLVHCIMLVSSPIVKMQMKRCGKEMVPMTYFYNEEEAMEFLNTLYY